MTASCLLVAMASMFLLWLYSTTIWLDYMQVWLDHTNIYKQMSPDDKAECDRFVISFDGLMHQWEYQFRDGLIVILAIGFLWYLALAKRALVVTGWDQLALAISIYAFTLVIMELARYRKRREQLWLEMARAAKGSDNMFELLDIMSRKGGWIVRFVARRIQALDRPI